MQLKLLYLNKMISIFNVEDGFQKKVCHACRFQNRKETKVFNEVIQMDGGKFEAF